MISVGQTMWMRFFASTAIAGPSSGHPSRTHLSSLTRSGGANVLPPSRDAVNAMSRMLPGYTWRHAAKTAPSAAVASAVLQQ